MLLQRMPGESNLVVHHQEQCNGSASKHIDSMRETSTLYGFGRPETNPYVPCTKLVRHLEGERTVQFVYSTES